MKMLDSHFRGNDKYYFCNRYYLALHFIGTQRGTLRTGKEIRFRFGSSEDKAGKEAKRRPTGW